jgi:hypothetical protein
MLKYFYLFSLATNYIRHLNQSLWYPTQLKWMRWWITRCFDKGNYMEGSFCCFGLGVILDALLTSQSSLAMVPDMVIHDRHTLAIYFIFGSLRVTNSLKRRLAYCMFVKNIVLTTLDAHTNSSACLPCPVQMKCTSCLDINPSLFFLFCSMMSMPSLLIFTLVPHGSSTLTCR